MESDAEYVEGETMPFLPTVIGMSKPEMHLKQIKIEFMCQAKCLVNPRDSLIDATQALGTDSI